MTQSVETPTAVLRKTALNAAHRVLGARVVDFGGWEMPIEYPQTSFGAGGLMREHLAVRNAVGIFDVSHMGDIRIAGAEALAAVQHISMNDASRLAIGQAHYSALLYPRGTFVDDVIVHRLGESEYLLVINAGTREKDWSWVRENVRGFNCKAEDLSDKFTQIAIQGPRAAEIVGKLTDANLSVVKNYWFTHGTFCGLENTLIARTGYTGEDGFEVYIPSDEATSKRVWDEILETGRPLGVLPCGLGARNTLRLEAKMALYGHEISDSITVLEAGLERYAKFEKPEFIGREALSAQKEKGITRTLVGIESRERGIPRDEYNVCDASGKRIGYVTSGSHAPYLKRNIALAYVPPDFSAIGAEVFVDIRGQQVRCEVVPTPFYKRAKKS